MEGEGWPAKVVEVGYVSIREKERKRKLSVRANSCISARACCRLVRHTQAGPLLCESLKQLNEKFLLVLFFQKYSKIYKALKKAI